MRIKRRPAAMLSVQSKMASAAHCEKPAFVVRGMVSFCYCKLLPYSVTVRLSVESVPNILHFDLMQCSYLKAKTSVQSLSFVKMNYEDPSSICAVEF